MDEHAEDILPIITGREPFRPGRAPMSNLLIEFNGLVLLLPEHVAESRPGEEGEFVELGVAVVGVFSRRTPNMVIGSL
jgi:hypothetical protein